MKKPIFVHLVATLVVAFSLVSCKDDDGNAEATYAPVSLSAQEMTISQQSVDFAHDFFKAYDKTQNGGNYIVSPLSLEYALSMTANGSSGDALDQILTALGFETSELKALNTYYKKLMVELPKVSNKNLVSIYNGMWYNSTLVSGINPDFQTALSAYFDCRYSESNEGNIVNKVNKGHPTFRVIRQSWSA